MAQSKNLPYRPCVGIMLLNAANQVFVAKRIDNPTDAWQMPQGGIDKGEEPDQAALRELEEEIGTNKAHILCESDGWHNYDLPKDLIGKIWKGKYRGQTQKWFALRFDGQDQDVNIATKHPEFSEWKWCDIQEVPNLIVPFKKKVYQAVVTEFSKKLGL